MRKIIGLCLALVLALAGVGCGAAPESVEAQAGYSFDQTTFCYGEVRYDLMARSPSINQIIDVTPVGSKLVIQCHVGPENSIYCIFDTTEERFQEDLVGCHLTWHSDDLDTAVWSCWGEIMAYDGSVLASYELPEGEYIGGLAYSEDHTRLDVEIGSVSGADRIVSIALFGSGSV